MFDLSKIVSAALPLIQRFEGLRLIAYPDPATAHLSEEQAAALHPPRKPGDPWTIGYGATGPAIAQGTVWTQAQADSDLSARVEALAKMIGSEITNADMTEEAIGACVSLAYNIGIHAFAGSSVLRHINAGDLSAAADAFMMWNKAGGQINAGLVKRRTQERAAFVDALGIS